MLLKTLAFPLGWGPWQDGERRDPRFVWPWASHFHSVSPTCLTYKMRVGFIRQTPQ